MRVKSLLFLIATIILSSSCNVRQQNNFEYSEGLSSYMQRVHDFSIEKSKNQILYFLKLNSCEPCVASHLEILKSVKDKKFNLVLIGTTDQNLSEIMANQNITIFTDLNSEITKYRTGMGKPMIVHIKNGKIIYQKSFYDSDIEMARSYLINN
ncbi:MAG: hypothetical protein ACJAXB_000482 [Candidatus Endobugula sp.]|jgi:hypothetical protein